MFIVKSYGDWDWYFCNVSLFKTKEGAVRQLENSFKMWIEDYNFKAEDWKNILKEFEKKWVVWFETDDYIVNYTHWDCFEFIDCNDGYDVYEQIEEIVFNSFTK
jgi:hypothetical protein